MQFNMAGLQKKWENKQFHNNVPGVAADVNHQMVIVLVGIYRVQIEEWGGLVLDWMSLACLPGAQLNFDNFVKRFFAKRLRRTVSIKLFKDTMYKSLWFASNLHLSPIYCCYKRWTCWADGRQQGLQLSIWELKKLASESPKQLSLLQHSPVHQNWEESKWSPTHR